MSMIVRFLAILFGGIADGLASFDRGMRDYNEFCKGMRTMSLRQRVKYLEVCNATNQLAIDALREGLKQALCDEHVPIVDNGVWRDMFNREHNGYRRLVCSKCGKVLVDRLGQKEYLEFMAKKSGESALAFQEQLEQLLSDKTGDE